MFTYKKLLPHPQKHVYTLSLGMVTNEETTLFFLYVGAKLLYSAMILHIYLFIYLFHYSPSLVYIFIFLAISHAIFLTDNKIRS